MRTKLLICIAGESPEMKAIRAKVSELLGVQSSVNPEPDPTAERRWAVFTNDNSAPYGSGDIDLEDYAKWITEHMRRTHSKKLSWDDLMGLYEAWTQSSKFTPADRDPLAEEGGDLDDGLSGGHDDGLMDDPTLILTEADLKRPYSLFVRRLRAEGKEISHADGAYLYEIWRKTSVFAPKRKRSVEILEALRREHGISLRHLPGGKESGPFVVHNGVLIDHAWGDERLFDYIDDDLPDGVRSNLVFACLRKGHIDFLWANYIPVGFENTTTNNPHGNSVEPSAGDGWDLTSRTLANVKKSGW